MLGSNTKTGASSILLKKGLENPLVTISVRTKYIETMDANR
jgi:hypothetical protein